MKIKFDPQVEKCYRALTPHVGTVRPRMETHWRTRHRGDYLTMNKRPRALDLYCGLGGKKDSKHRGGWAQALRDLGWDVTTVDFDRAFQPDICIDVLKLTAADLREKYGHFDFIVASPPCESYSVCSIGHHWQSSGVPKSQKAKDAIILLKHTIDLIEELKPSYWLLENPVGMMRKIPFMQLLPQQTVTYCQYGDTGGMDGKPRQKPTDLWGRMPEGFKFRPMCKRGAPCHVAAPRGSSTGTQGGKSYAEKSLIPYDLAHEVASIVTKAFGGQWMTTLPVVPKMEYISVAAKEENVPPPEVEPFSDEIEQGKLF